MPSGRKTPEERRLARARKIAAAAPAPAGGPEVLQPSPAEAVAEIREQVMVEGAFGAPDTAIDILTLDAQTLLTEHETLTAAMLAEEQELGKASFWYFVTEHLFPTTWQKHYSPEFHKDICYALQDLKRGEDLWIFIQREGKKSFIADMAHTIWLIVRDPNIRVLLIGAREETVKPFARIILGAFEKGTPGFERFQEIYHQYVIEGRGRQLKQVFQFTHPLRTIALPDPTFRASYLAVSGAGWRCDVLKFDDPVERRSVNTPEMSAKTSRQIMDLFPLVDTGSQYKNIIGMGTRWSYHDPYGLIIGEQAEDEALAEVAADLVEYPKPQVFIRHAMEDPKRSCEHCPPDVVRRHPHGHPSMADDAVATCYPIHTRESLMQQLGRYRMDPNLGEALFWHQYQNVCMAPSAQKFKKEWFFDVEIVDWVAPKLRALLLDSASKDFQTANRGDWMVALFVSFDENARMLVRHGIRSNRWTKDEFLRQILSWCKVTGWWPRVVAKEKFGADGSGPFLTDIGQMFASEIRPVHLLAVTRPPELLKKNDWIVENLQGPFERGEILWGSKVSREIRDRAEYELCNLNQVAHEDVADTLALGMAKGVRPAVVYRPTTAGAGWEAPQLGLYDPGGVGPPPEFEQTSPMKKAAASPLVQVAIADLGFSEVSWDPKAAPSVPGVALPDFE